MLVPAQKHNGLSLCGRQHIIFENKMDITKIISLLQDSGLEVELEHDMVGFLGVLIDQNNEKSQYTLTQTGLIERIINILNIKGAKGRRIPAELRSLPSDKDGNACNESFNFESVVKMLSYLSCHTRSEIEFAVHHCGQYAHNP